MVIIKTKEIMDFEQINIFGINLNILWQNIANAPCGLEVLAKVKLSINQNILCENNKFYLAINQVAHYLLMPEQNICFIERINPSVSTSIVMTWLTSTVFAYLLQYRGYLVLHGSAIKINNQAIIFSGQSGAGKSTLAAAMLTQNTRFLTDDVCAITTDSQGKMMLVAGPPKLKLWGDALIQLNYDAKGLQPVLNKMNKYELPLSIVNPANNTILDKWVINTHGIDRNLSIVPISHFYELKPDLDTTAAKCITITGINKLQILINNTYRYGLLKPLVRLKTHLNGCSALAAQIKIAQIIRPKTKLSNDSLAELIALIQQDLNSSNNYEYHQGKSHAKFNSTNFDSTY